MILLDTDVLVDVAIDRRPFAASSSDLLDRLERFPGSGAIAWHTASNFYYLVARAQGDGSARDFIAELIRFLMVAQTDTEALRYAASLSMLDFEDAMQVAAARSCGATHIVTRNLRDYVRSPIPAITPQEAISVLS